MKINSMSELRRLAGVKSMGDAECPTLLDIEICSEQDDPNFGVKCKIFELDACQGIGKNAPFNMNSNTGNAKTTISSHTEIVCTRCGSLAFRQPTEINEYNILLNIERKLSISVSYGIPYRLIGNFPQHIGRISAPLRFSRFTAESRREQSRVHKSLTQYKGYWPEEETKIKVNGKWYDLEFCLRNEDHPEFGLTRRTKEDKVDVCYMSEGKEQKKIIPTSRTEQVIVADHMVTGANSIEFRNPHADVRGSVEVMTHRGDKCNVIKQLNCPKTDLNLISTTNKVSLMRKLGQETMGKGDYQRADQSDQVPWLHVTDAESRMSRHVFLRYSQWVKNYTVCSRNITFRFANGWRMLLLVKANAKLLCGNTRASEICYCKKQIEPSISNSERNISDIDIDIP
ncbi:hypothetical protein ANN_26893 [Periplaneta americana]|uniref:Uncharacterized protein n=1 Tax=Periplaneta americana TaxID=6978 RepID=A0ABQ8RWJ4_PERAM|nr:hypothetical protein ANN_26893 [Periplaneta americana]